MAGDKITALNGGVKHTAIADDDVLAITDVSEAGTGTTKPIERGELLKDIINLNLNEATELTIDAAGAVTLTQAWHTIDTAADGATDNLDTISGMSEGDVAYIRAENDARTVVIRHDQDNISCVGGSNITMDDVEDFVILIYDAGLTKVLALTGGGGGGLSNIVEDITPQLGGDLDLNGHNIDFPTTANISDVLDEDAMGSDSATALATQQSIKVYVNNAVYCPCDTRLSLTTAVPVTTADVTDAITLYAALYKGNKLPVFDGTNWVIHEITERSLAIGGFTASKPHDVWIYNNAGTLTLAVTEWTNGTTRATALTTQDGVYVKTGATNYRYLGTIYIDSGQKCQDTVLLRHVWNNYNRVPRILRVVEATNSWVYTSATWRAANNSTANRVAAVIGVSEEPVVLNVSVSAGQTGTYSRNAGIGIDVTNANNAGIKSLITGIGYYPITSYYIGFPGAGYHYFQWTEYAEANGTATWLGDNNNNALVQSGMIGEIWA